MFFSAQHYYIGAEYGGGFIRSRQDCNKMMRSEDKFV